MTSKKCDDCKHFRIPAGEATDSDWVRCRKGFQATKGRVACIEHETKEEKQK
jgi:hypothetical protein